MSFRQRRRTGVLASMSFRQRGRTAVYACMLKRKSSRARVQGCMLKLHGVLHTGARVHVEAADAHAHVCEPSCRNDMDTVYLLKVRCLRGHDVRTGEEQGVV